MQKRSNEKGLLRFQNDWKEINFDIFIRKVEGNGDCYIEPPIAAQCCLHREVTKDKSGKVLVPIGAGRGFCVGSDFREERESLSAPLIQNIMGILLG